MLELSLNRPDDRHDQLAALGLAEQSLLSAVQAGEDARGRATLNDPPNAAGTLDYFARIRALRELLFFESGWKRMNHQQLPLVVNPERTIAVGVLLGDHRTGIPGIPHPRTVRPQGNAKAGLVTRNQELALFPAPQSPLGPDEVELEEGELARLQTWFLLTYRYEARRKSLTGVRSELSLPESIGPMGKIDRWQHRIPLSVIEWQIAVDYPGEQSPEIDVPLEER